ncbi:MAG: aspartate-alanine antiporter, partial [Pseudomonadota bacterium]|nr:aspartate-alanine antiporter [Pseudomonadota bacterium]
MEHLQSLFTESPILPLFIAIALGYAIGKIRIGQFQLGGLAGTLLAAIGIGVFGVETDDAIKTIAFALFIYSLGYVSGPQFFGSLGRKTFGQVHLAIFSSVVIFATIWGLAQIFDLDKGTAAGLLAGATTESASIGTASDALRNLNLGENEVKRLQANIAVTYAVTYLFGMTLVIFFTSKLAPRLLKVKDFPTAAKALEEKLGAYSGLEPGQFEFLREIIARVYRVESDGGAGLTIGKFEKQYEQRLTFQQIYREGEPCDPIPDFVLQAGDLVTLVGAPEEVVEVGRLLGVEAAHRKIEESLIGEMRDVVVTRKDRVNKTVATLRKEIDPGKRRGAYAVRVTRMERDIPLLPKTEAQLGDVVRLIGIPNSVRKLADELGHTLTPNEGVDYIYLALGIICGIIVGGIPIPIAGTEVEMGVGGGCLISGLLFGWLRAKHPTFGNLPSATAAHLRDFGLSVFIATIGLEAGPQALHVIQDQGVMLPLFAVTVVLISLLTSMLYARFVLKM